MLEHDERLPSIHHPERGKAFELSVCDVIICDAIKKSWKNVNSHLPGPPFNGLTEEWFEEINFHLSSGSHFNLLGSET